jgi:hypothetical protein
MKVWTPERIPMPHAEIKARVRREMMHGQGLGPIMRHPVPLAPRFSRFRHFPEKASFWQRWFARRTAKDRNGTESTGYLSVLVVSRVRFSNEDDITPALFGLFCPAGAALPMFWPGIISDWSN